MKTQLDPNSFQPLLFISFLFFLYYNPVSSDHHHFSSSHLTTEGLLELLGELLYDTVALNIVHVVIQRITGHLPQGTHVHASHSNGKNLNASIPRTLRHFLHIVLRTPICDNYGNL